MAILGVEMLEGGAELSEVTLVASAISGRSGGESR